VGRLADRLEEAFMVVTLAAMTLLTFLQVVLRYLFGTGFVWSLEVTTYLFAWLVLIGMSYGVRTQAHIAVDLLTAKLPPRTARGVALVALALGLTYCALMIFGGVAFVARLIELGNAARDIPVQRWVLTAVMPFGFVLLAIRLLQAAFLPLRAQPQK
jgi:C4-dicarboxylate transporter, DctQ subunit